MAKLEERQDAMDMAFMAIMTNDQTAAEQEGRDCIGSLAEAAVGPLDYDLRQSERQGDINPRLRRVIERAKWLLAGNPYDPLD
ncbi:hypothetical protein GGQ87_002328 [Brevundimonas alba]|uniref:Uncharacterized protein n=1 Tax=Brevundimonas alba TaxID=74314 RepID=A0A7X5YLB6_9CAUL|nr:hypothetical protein [Brevundimonas alba]NJC42033.1 hypothetical protein [Brevundimonas alba]